MVLKFLGELYIFIMKVIWYWWWVPVPFWLHKKLTQYYLFWANWEFWYKGFDDSRILLEIIPPKNLAKTFKTMETIYSALWGSVYTPPNYREIWLEGKPTNYGGPEWFTFEIASIGGEVHFYARIPDKMTAVIEATIYSQYPDAEIFPAKEDYTKNVPADAPNDMWDVRGEDFQLVLNDAIPILTYPQFFEPQMGKIDEQRLVDPLHALMESITNIKAGDQIWMQLGLTSILNGDKLGPDQAYSGEFTSYTEIAQEAIDKAKGKKKKAPGPSWLLNFLDQIFDPTEFISAINQFLGSRALERTKIEEKEEKEKQLSSYENERLKAIEEKVNKRSYLCFLRTVYVYDKSKPHIGGGGPQGKIREYLQHFAGYNSIKFWPYTRTKVNYWLRPRMLYCKKRKIFTSYVKAHPPMPRWNFVPNLGLFVMNIEELATIFHFPNQMDSPRMYQVGPKKSEPPTNLPIEE